MLFDVIPENFFSPLAAPGKIVYWECICRLFSVTSKQLSFGVERDVLVDELQYYFESTMSADIPGEELEETGSIDVYKRQATLCACVSLSQNMDPRQLPLRKLRSRNLLCIQRRPSLQRRKKRLSRPIQIKIMEVMV